LDLSVKISGRSPAKDYSAVAGQRPGSGGNDEHALTTSKKLQKL
jgi:hypothetical protein